MSSADAADVFHLDGHDVPFTTGETVLAATSRAGRYIPHLCWHPDFAPHGSCRVCTVRVGARLVPACTLPAATGLVVESDTAELRHLRLRLLQLLFVEGNHFCPSCEKSGDCQLQATAYAVDMTGPHFEEFYPARPVVASHPDILLDLNRCILCSLCVRASREVDGKSVFALGGHGIDTHLLIDSPSGRLVDTDFAPTDRAASICPVGVILPKRRGFAVPIGERRFDQQPISAAEEGDP